MPLTAATGGVSLTNALQELVKNPSTSKEIRTYEIRFSNIDGTNSADITQCVLIDASAANAQRPILPVKTTIVPGGDGAKFTRITLDPGDAVQAAADFAGRIYALVQQVFAEAAP